MNVSIDAQNPGNRKNIFDAPTFKTSKTSKDKIINICMMVHSVFPQYPNAEISVSLFQDVSNANELRSQVRELPFAFIDAKMICSIEQLYSAIYRALTDSTYNKLKTKSLHSECLLCLSPSSNIGDAFKNFGIKDNSTEVIGVQLIEPNEKNNVRTLKDFIQGDELEFDDENLAKFYDQKEIRKVCSYQPQHLNDYRFTNFFF